MDRGLASLCWRCPGLRLHSVQSIHRFINGGEGFDTLKENVVLDDRGASSTDDCRSNSDKEDWETAFALLIGGICVATVGSFLFYVAYVFLRRRHQLALEAILESRCRSPSKVVAAKCSPRRPISVRFPRAGWLMWQRCWRER